MRERRGGLLECRRRIRQPPERGAVRILPLLHGRAGNRPAVVHGRRQIGQHRPRVAAARRTVQPAARHVRVALVHEEFVAGVLGRVAPPGLVKVAEHDVASAVVDLVHQDVVAPGDVDRLEHVELEGVLDQAVRVARRVLEIHDPGVQGSVRIGDGRGGPEQDLVRADRPERPAAERRLMAGDVEPSDARMRQRHRRGFLRSRLTGTLAPAQPDPEYDRQQVASELHHSPPASMIKPAGACTTNRNRRHVGGRQFLPVCWC